MTDIFSDQNKSGDQNAPASSESQSASDLLAQLVGEGKKFKTVEDLARGKLEADSFIENLKSEQKELRDSYRELEERYNKAKTVEEVLKGKRDESGEGNQPQQISTEEILKLVDERFTKRTQAQAEAANAERANAAVLKHFNGDGAKAREFIRSESQRLGVDDAFLKDMSAKSPEAFLRLIGINQPRSNPGVAFDNQMNSEARTSEGVVRDAKYYSALRKQLGSKFYEPDIQQARLRDRKALGDRFFK